MHKFNYLVIYCATLTNVMDIISFLFHVRQTSCNDVCSFTGRFTPYHNMWQLIFTSHLVTVHLTCNQRVPQSIGALSTATWRALALRVWASQIHKPWFSLYFSYLTNTPVFCNKTVKRRTWLQCAVVKVTMFVPGLSQLQDFESRCATVILFITIKDLN